MLQKGSKGHPVRSVLRALNVLQAINRHGQLSLMQISKAVDLPYASTSRLVNTLLHEGVIERGMPRKYFRPTPLSEFMSCGYQPNARRVAIARPHIISLTEETGWPISLVTRVGSVMTIHDSTHSLTTITFTDCYIDYSLPVLSSAAGLVYLAFMDAGERGCLIDKIRDNLIGEIGIPSTFSDQQEYFAKIRKTGYCSMFSNHHLNKSRKSHCFAVPLYHSGKVFGAMTVDFLSTPFEATEAFEKYSNSIFETQENINRDYERIKSS